MNNNPINSIDPLGLFEIGGIKFFESWGGGKSGKALKATWDLTYGSIADAGKEIGQNIATRQMIPIPEGSPVVDALADFAETNVSDKIDEAQTTAGKVKAGIGIAAGALSLGKWNKLEKIADEIMDAAGDLNKLDKKVDLPDKKVNTKVEDVKSKELLPGEGDVGTFKELNKKGTKGDNITPHHMPSADYMKSKGVDRKDGISMNAEQPHPGKGGRHRRTRSYGKTSDKTETPREALARDVKDARKVYREDGVYNDKIKNSLKEVIKQNKEKHPDLFEKK